MSIKSDLTALKTNIQAAKDKLYTNLTEKGVTDITTASTLDAMADSVSGIKSGGGNFVQPDMLLLRMSNISGKLETPNLEGLIMTNTSNMFSGCSGTTLIIFDDSFDTSKVTNMSKMFSQCRSLTELDLSSFDTSNVTNMSEMFNNCSGLTSLNLSSFNTSKVTNMGQMFANCSKLTSLDLSSFDTSNVTSMSGMFYCCTKLTSLDLSSFETSNVTDMSSAFSGCTSLTSLDLSSFDTSNVTYMKGMFYNCNNLTSITFNVNSDFSSLQYTDDIFSGNTAMFNRCSKLVRIENFDIQNFNTNQYSNDYTPFGNSNSTLRYANFRNLGNNINSTQFNFKPLTYWGVNTTSVTDARDSLIFALITSSFDRASNGYPICTVTLSPNTLKVLTETEIAQITAKGFTIA